MSLFVVPSETLLDQITDRVEQRDHFQPQLQALEESRESGAVVVPKGDGWMHIASVSAPLWQVAKLLEPGFFRNKKMLYGWLDKHPRWLTYDRRKWALSNTHFRFDGVQNGDANLR